MSEMNDEIFEDLKDAYVLDALPEEERRAFEDYLAAHPERQAEIDELGAVAGLLAFAPHELEPSPHLRSGIMEIVQSEASPRRTRRGSALTRLWGYLGARGLALGAAALLVVGLLSWNLLLQGQVGDLQGEVQNSQDQVEDLQGQVQEAQARRQVQQSPTIELEGSWASQGAEAEVASINGDRLILVTDNLPSVPDDKTCQIWVIKGDSPPSPSGLFQPDGNMTATPITNSIENADTIAVTVEPAGGSDQPTTEPVLQAKL
jgi:anti-sigma-K factor RskA